MGMTLHSNGVLEFEDPTKIISVQKLEWVFECLGWHKPDSSKEYQTDPQNGTYFLGGKL